MNKKSKSEPVRLIFHNDGSVFTDPLSSSFTIPENFSDHNPEVVKDYVLKYAESRNFSVNLANSSYDYVLPESMPLNRDFAQEVLVNDQPRLKLLTKCSFQCQHGPRGKQGFTNLLDGSEAIKKGGISCPFNIAIQLNPDGSYHLKVANLNHNHVLSIDGIKSVEKAIGKFQPGQAIPIDQLMTFTQEEEIIPEPTIMEETPAIKAPIAMDFDFW